MSWQERLPFFLSQFLALQNINQTNPIIYKTSAIEIFWAINELHLSEKRGMFEFLGLKLNVNPKTVKNYYHNTWVKQFFHKILPFRFEIFELVRYAVVNGFELCEAIKVFIARHLDKVFNMRQLQQVFNIAKYKIQDQIGAEGFSVSINQCIAFQTACQMQE
ncbi:Conserved_hypothetical protein [Hexamita inflata]|uniref:Uncharacterized protein n=1 Tax=Hexamita inflata TaxID=28002 RepID=A0AA86PGX5_9EUKA|nr:Conserved hypothetical protein [Hexamita inflata]